MHTVMGKWSVVVAAATMLVAGLTAGAADLGARDSTVAGVGVQVTPMEIGTTAPEWRFAVSLNTHSQDLADDLATEAVIIDAQGNAQRALGWEGDGAGGHHRKGVLRFARPSPQPRVIEVRIQRAGEAAPRTFRWSAQAGAQTASPPNAGVSGATMLSSVAPFYNFGSVSMAAGKVTHR